VLEWVCFKIKTMNQELELFVKNANLPISDNIKESLKSSEKISDELIQLFKELCLSNEVSFDDMRWNSYHNNGDTLYYKSIRIPDNQRIGLLNLKYSICENISLYSCTTVEDYGYKKEVVEIEIEDYTFWKRIARVCFGKKIMREVYKNSFDIKTKKEYYISSFEFKKEISEEEFNLLSFFFKEQKLRKKIDNNVDKYISFKIEKN